MALSLRCAVARHYCRQLSQPDGAVHEAASCIKGCSARAAQRAFPGGDEQGRGGVRHVCRVPHAGRVDQLLPRAKRSGKECAVGTVQKDMKRDGKGKRLSVQFERGVRRIQKKTTNKYK